MCSQFRKQFSKPDALEIEMLLFVVLLLKDSTELYISSLNFFGELTKYDTNGSNI